MNVNEIRPNIPSSAYVKQTHKNAQQAFDEKLNAASAKNAVEKVQSPEVFSASEREYFEQLFPESTEEVRSYNPYQRDGLKKTVTLGTIVDRKG